MGITVEHATEEEFLRGVHYRHDEGRYEVNLPWKPGFAPISDGYAMCIKRLHQLRSRLNNDKSLLKEYDGIINDQERMGIIEPAVDTEENSHFLPHHGVLREDKETTKLRVVFDGSAKSGKDDLSLNDCLEKGPNLVPRIFDTVVKFRGYPIGIVADIEKAFHQVQIAPEDRKMLKFLWFEDINQESPVIKEYQFRRLPFGLTPSPAILSSTIHHHLSQYTETEPEIVSLLTDSLYVDDFAGGAHDDAEALRIYQTSQDLMSKGGFQLRKWHSNSPYLRDIIATEKDAKSISDGNQASPPSIQSNADTSMTETVMEGTTSRPSPVSGVKSKGDCHVKFLGLNWNAETDEFRYDLREMVEYAQSLPTTKRSVLKFSAKIFDPIGLVTPFTVNMKILFQSLCTTNVNWDDELEGKELARWNSLVKELKSLNDVRVPRCYFHCIDNLPRNHEIHGFCDASDSAFAAVVYLRTEHSNGEVEVNLIASKTRVAPIKKQTTLRLELLGANILARLVTSIIPAITSIRATPNVVLWTDSLTTLCWIRNHKAWKQYVQNRVKEIRELTSEYQWRHCPGELNPADLPSRGCSGQELAKNEIWWNGPIFLKGQEEKWPKDPQPTSKDRDHADVEMIKHPPSITHSLSGISHSTDNVIEIEKIIDYLKYSTRDKLLRVTARVLRFLKRTRKKSCSTSVELQADELQEAENLWIRSIQSTAFVEEIRCIRSGLSNPMVNQLRMYIDDDQIVRCEGRINHSTLPDTAKQPILLPSKHGFTAMIIRESHKIVLHDGIRETLNCVRGKYWVPRGREAVKRILKKCVVCKKFQGNAFATPREPPLPPSRVSEEPPFTNTGIDFAGPLYVTTTQATKKVYVCLFTCASTRAVHLELVDSLSTPTFLQAFRRFAARRGLPARLITDNAKTFKAAVKEVKNIMRSTDIQRQLATKGVQWEFIVEKAPWHGGFWERMVQSTKRCLKKSLGRSSLDFESLRTLLVEIETTLNNRPLTYVYDDEESISYPLTPSQLIYGRQIVLTPSEKQFDIISTNQSLTKKAKYHRRMLVQFMNRWKNEYLLSIREASRTLHGPTAETIAVGDVVVLKKDGSSRIFWKLATVQELLRSKDGIVRSAKVRVVNTEKGKAIELRRPIQHLIPLELRISPDPATNDPDPEPEHRPETDDPPRQRPR